MFFPCRKKNKKRKDKSSLPVLYKDMDFCRGRISLSIFYRGSLTLEAACILPLFLCAVLAILYFGRIIAAAGDVAEGLQEAGKEMAVYAYAKEAAGDVKGIEFAKVLSLVYAKSKIGEKGSAADLKISLLSSSILQEDDIIDLVAEYKVQIPVPLLNLGSIPMRQRARVRAWTGRKELEGSKDGEKVDRTTVYVTVNGKVYHKDRECTHIRLSVHRVSKGEVSGLRNQDGGKYYPCEECGAGAGGFVYITDSGDRYHSSAGCSGLKRSVIAVPLTQVESWPPCSKCGG